MISKSSEEYLKTMYILKQQNGNIRVTDIAKKMNCTKPSVNKAIYNLKDSGLLNYESYGTIELTEKGEDLAKKILEAYDIVYVFLKDVLNLEEKEADTLIVSVQNNKYNFKDFMFKVRDKNIRVILLLENAEQKELRDALLLGIYDIIFDPFTLEDVCKKIDTPSAFSDIAKYIKDIMELENI